VRPVRDTRSAHADNEAFVKLWWRVVHIAVDHQRGCELDGAVVRPAHVAAGSGCRAALVAEAQDVPLDRGERAVRVADQRGRYVTV
jgi:hypothetical protein